MNSSGEPPLVGLRCARPAFFVTRHAHGTHALPLLILALILFLPKSLRAQVDHGTNYAVNITNFSGYVDLHYITIPNKNNYLQGAWVYPSNSISQRGYTNLLWTNLTTYPPLPPPGQHLYFKDYSVTNRVTNRYRIYRLQHN